MQYTDTLFLAILQGLTEFLPISSSGHLVIGQELLNISLPGNAFEVVLHIGTLMSVLTVFRKEIKSLVVNINDSSNQHYIYALIFGTIPAFLVGLFLKDYISLLFDNIRFVSLSLVFTGIMLITSKFINKRNVELTLFIGFVIGLAQAIAIIPGISRSGATICMAILMGLSAPAAARFSFLLGIPAITLAGLVELKETINSQNYFTAEIIPLIVGITAAMIVSWLVIDWLLKYLQKNNTWIFVIYRLLFGLILLVWW